MEAVLRDVQKEKENIVIDFNIYTQLLFKYINYVRFYFWAELLDTVRLNDVVEQPVQHLLEATPLQQEAG